MLASTAAFAQLETASIVGTVLDPSGAVIPKATVEVQNQGTAATVSLTSDSNGNFIAPVLQIGTYRITASAPGFKTRITENITLRVSDRTRVDVTLEPGVVTEKVTVMSEAPVVETASTTLGGVVNTQQVSDLPLNGRSLTQLLIVVPGVVFLGPQRSMNGASQGRLFESGLKYLVDGGDSGQVDSDLGDGGYQSSARISRASVDSVAEVRVVESSYSAEYGQSVGGVINFITKSGTNQMHGSLFEYFRNNVLDARNYFNVPPAIQPAFRLNQFGGSLSGPIIKDRFFYFVNYEGVRQRLGVIQNVFVPTDAFRATLSPVLQTVTDQLPHANGPVSPTEPRLAQFIRGVSNQLTEDTGSFKLDYAATAKDRLSVRYNRNQSTTLSNFGVQTGGFRSVPAILQLTKLSYTKTISPTLLNESSFAVNRWNVADPGSDVAATRNFPLTTIGGGSAGVGPTLFDLRVGNTSFTALDTLTWVKGRHQLKFGGQIVRNRDNKASNLQTITTFLSLDLFAANKPFQVQTNGNPTVGMRNTYYNFFAQDDIQVSRNLTINAGVRYQFDSTPSESHGRIANFDPILGKLDPIGTNIFDAPKLNFEPRIGLAYTPFTSKQTVVRAGYGIFHSSLIAAQPQSLPANVPGLNFNAVVNVLTNPSLIGFPTPDLTSIQGATSYWAMDKNWHTAYTQNWNLNIQQGFGQDMVLQVGYIGNHSVHLVPYRELNPIVPALGHRVYPAFGSISQFFGCCNATYNALQTSFKRRLSKGFTFDVNYTWSHSLDQGGLTFGAQAQNFNDYTTEHGSSDYDARHNLEFDYTYEIPGIPRVPKVIGSGWQVNGITVMRSGLPVTVVCGCDSNGNGVANERADVVPGVSQTPSNKDIPSAQFNIAAFTAPKPGTVGNAGRNILRAPAAYNTDFSLFKNFKVRERQTLQFRAESFNLFNTPEFSNPGANLAAPATFGRSLSTIATTGGFSSNRQMQFALRYGF
jgi:outer membrane receptor protein involved in Fe transport